MNKLCGEPSATLKASKSPPAEQVREIFMKLNNLLINHPYICLICYRTVVMHEFKKDTLLMQEAFHTVGLLGMFGMAAGFLLGAMYGPYVLGAVVLGLGLNVSAASVFTAANVIFLGKVLGACGGAAVLGTVGHYLGRVGRALLSIGQH